MSSDMVSSDPERQAIRVSGRNPYDIARDVADAIVKGNEPPVLFAMGDATVLLRDNGSLLALDRDNGAGWLAYVARDLDFVASNAKGGKHKVAPPGPVMKILPEILREELPPLDGVMTAPYLDRDGSVVAVDGYNPDSHLVLRMRGLRLPAVSDKPSPAEVSQAVRLLNEEWLGDFPFASNADRACAIAELLTVIGRQFFPLAPMFVNDASSAGSGKGLLTTTLSQIATGEPPHFMELPADGDEQRKTITAALLEGRSVIAWDESHIIQGRSLAAVMTSDVYSGRLLGSSKMIAVRNRFTQIALGNNVEVRGDMRRRVVPCRMVPQEERPELRTGFRHPDLKQWVAANRGKLLWAALTLCRNWSAKGKPDGTMTMGSFEKWARVLSGILAAAGINEFGANTSEWLSYSEDDDGWAAHFAELRQRYKTNPFTVADVVDAVNSGLLARPPVRRDDRKTLVELIGYGYRSQREKIKGGRWLVRSESKNSRSGGRTWKIRERGDSGAAAAGEPESWSVSSVSSVLPGQRASDGTDHRADHRSMVSNPDDSWSVMVSDGQYGPSGTLPDQSPATDHTDHTDHKNGATTNEVSRPARTASPHTGERSEDDWASLIGSGPGSGRPASVRSQPKRHSRADRRGR